MSHPYPVFNTDSTRTRRCVLALALATALYAGMGMAPVAAQVVPDRVVVTVPGTYPSPWLMPGSGTNYVYGHLVIESGGTVGSSGEVVIGQSSPFNPQGWGKVSLRGPGAVWNHAGLLCIACTGESMANFSTTSGEVRVENGAVVNAGDTVIARPGGFGELTISGQGSVWNTRNLSIATQARGISAARLNLLDGAILNTHGESVITASSIEPQARVGNGATVTVSGAGTRWNADGGIFFGGGANLIVTSGAVVAAPGIEMRARGIATSPMSGSSIFIGASVENGTPSAPLSPGVLDVGFIRVLGAGSVNFNHTSSDYLFNARLEGGDYVAGAGLSSVNVYAGTTRMTANSGAFNGSLTVHGGRLLMDGTFGGAAQVRTGGTLGGAGSIQGNVTVDGGGVLAPGGSIGRLSVGGNLTFLPGSVLEVEVTPQGQSDNLAVSGRAIISGGSVMTLAQGAGFRPLTDYTLLTASGGVEGRFDGASSNYAFLTALLSYEFDAVRLRLARNDVRFADYGATQNQRAAAQGAESTGAGSPVWNAFVVLDAAQASAALNSLSGEIHASSKSGALEDAHQVQQMILDRFREGDVARHTQAWVETYGRWSRVDSNGNAVALKRNSRGVLVGAEVPIVDLLRVGATFGAGRLHSELDTLGTHNSDGGQVHLGLYANLQSGRWNAGLGLLHTRFDTDVHREVHVAGFGDSFASKRKARGMQWFGELGYAFDWAGSELEPFLGFAYQTHDANGFRENAGVGALLGEASKDNVRYTSLGMRLRQKESDSDRWQFDGSLAWRRASGDLNPSSRLRFEGGSPFFVSGTEVAKDAAVLTARTRFKIGDRTSLALAYSGQFASDSEDHGASATLVAAF